MTLPKVKFLRLSKTKQNDLLNEYASARKTQKKAILKRMTSSELTKLMECTLARQKYNDSAFNDFYEMLELGVDKEKSLDALIELVAYQRPTNSYKFTNAQKMVRNALQDKSISKKISNALKIDISKNNLFAKEMKKQKLFLKKINPRITLNMLVDRKAINDKAISVDTMLDRLNRIQKNENQNLQLSEENLIRSSKFSKFPKNSMQMVYMFDKCTQNLIKHEPLFDKTNGYDFDNDNLTQTGRLAKKNLIREYTNILGEDKLDMAELLAKMELENYAGNPYVPTMENHPKFKHYIGEKEMKDYITGDYTSLADNIYNPYSQDYSKHLLGIEKIENFELNGINLGNVYVTKSELPPTGYIAENGEYTPLLEYFVKDKDGDLVRIGASVVDKKTGEIDKCIINIDKKDMSDELKFNLDNIFDNPKNIGFKPQDYKGEKIAYTRQDIENNIAKNAIQEYLSENKKIKNISQVNDLAFKPNGEHPMSSYLIEFEDNGKNSFDLVYMDLYGKCKKMPKLEIVDEQKTINFPTSNIKYDNNNKVLPSLERGYSLQSFKINGNEYSVYRDKNDYLSLSENVNYQDQLSMYKNITLSYPLNINCVLDTNSRTLAKLNNNILNKIVDNNIKQKNSELIKEK